MPRHTITVLDQPPSQSATPSIQLSLYAEVPQDELQNDKSILAKPYFDKKTSLAQPSTRIGNPKDTDEDGNDISFDEESRSSVESISYHSFDNI